MNFFSNGTCNQQSLETSTQYLEPLNNLTVDVSRLLLAVSIQNFFQ